MFSYGLVFSVFFVAISNCQNVHYVPAVLVPIAQNASQWNYFRPNNTAAWNNTNWNQNNNNWNRTNGTNWNNWNNWNGASNRGDLILGQINNADKLLFNQEYYKPSKWLVGREKTVDYPNLLPPGHVRQDIISAIRVLNLNKSVGNSNARIVGGGIGSKFVKIQLSSNRGHSFRYLVQIFGH